MTRRLGLLLLIAVACALCAWLAPDQQDAVVAAVMPSAKRATSAQTGFVRIPPIADRTLVIHEPKLASVDLFDPRNWTPPPVPAAAVTTTPTAPPLPFTFTGKQRQDGQWTVFLSIQDRILIAKEGDILEGQYQVQAIAPPNLSLLYIPLKTNQMLQIGGSD